jgi:hypothetical protein
MGGGGTGDGEEEEEGYGDFEDLQTNEVFGSSGQKKSVAKRGKSSDDEDSDDDDVDEAEQERRNMKIDQELRQMHAANKAQFKANFDKRYDEKALVRI